jgi:hypothetical protein
MANIVIDIASEFTGAKAFKQADTATQKLTSGVKKLAGAVGLAYGTSAVIAFGKASVKAAAADQKAQTQLALALKNVGLGRDAVSSEAYIQNLQSQFGIVDDLLRPAYQTLAVATRDSAEAQRLLNLSLDISASTGKDLGSVTAALSKAYLGNNTALSKLGVGIAKADLKAKSFNDITNQLTTTFAGSATAAANTFQGSVDKLGVASANVQEIIGTGLIDALKNLGKDTSIADLASNMEKTALYLADVIRGVGTLAAKLKDIPVLGNLNVGMIPIVGSYIELLRKAGTQTGTLTAADNAHLKSLQDAFKITTKTVKAAQTLTKLSAQQLKDLKLKAAIDKANLALGKSTDVFDIDKIQNAAALTNQAQLLGKATNGAAVLQIANDTARLNVKKSILALEDAIASKDEAAIIAATSKLNADLKVLDALTGQKTQMAAIESILKGLIPKDLINQKNLDDALAKIREMLALLAKVSVSTAGGSTAGKVAGGITGGITGGALGGAIGGTLLIDGKTEAELAAEAAGSTEEAAAAAAETAADAVETLAKIDEVIAELGDSVSVIGDNGKEFIALIDGVAETFQTLDDSTAFNALVNEFAKGNIGSFTAGSTKAAEGSLFGTQGIEDASAFNALVNSFANGAIGSFGAGSFRAGEGGSIFNSGAVGSRDRDFNITVNAGIGDPNAIAEAVNQVIRDAVDRGTLRGFAIE